MKQKKQNRILAALLAVAMMFQMLPMMAFAAEGTAPAAGKVKIGETEYDTVKEAVEAAESGATIILGEGNYTLYKVDSEGRTKGKDLTFVGQGTDKTAWNIGALVPDPANYGTEYNGDYSFDGAGTVTFRNMTLRSGSTDYLGFIRPHNTVVENCVVEGTTSYWGYTSAVFKNTTFKPKFNKYALWTYSSPTMTFDNCKFDCKWKAIKVYNEGNPIEIHFKDCTVTGCSYKSALQIDDNYANFKIYISGDNNVDALRDTYTCSKVYGFDNNSANHGKTEVYIGEGGNAELVWKDGKMVTHKHSDGEKEQKLTKTCTEWVESGSHYKRDVTTTCDYCHYTTKGVETGYKLEYELNGGVASEGADYTEKIVAENETVTLAAAPAPALEGVYFLGWEDENGNRYDAAAATKLTANTKLTAQWGEVPPVVPDTPDGGSGEIAAVIVAAGTTVIGYYTGTELLKHCYGLLYWPKNRSELALMLWEDADRPMPESALLYPDVGQEEEDMDLQHAARWAMENELIPDLNWDDSRTEEEMKFYPNYAVSRARALHAWRKAQQLKQDA